MKSCDKAVLVAIVSHIAKGKDSCFPSYETIKVLSGGGDDTIKDTIDLLSVIGVIEYRNRADIGKGKQNNEYRFIFSGVDYYKSKGEWKLSEDNRQALKKRIDEEIKIIKVARNKAKIERKANKKHKPNIPDNTTIGCLNTDSALLKIPPHKVHDNPTHGVFDNPSTRGIRKPQNPAHGVRGTKVSEGSTVTPVGRGRSSRETEEKGTPVSNFEYQARYRSEFTKEKNSPTKQSHDANTSAAIKNNPTGEDIDLLNNLDAMASSVDLFHAGKKESTSKPLPEPDTDGDKWEITI